MLAHDVVVRIVTLRRTGFCFVSPGMTYGVVNSGLIQVRGGQNDAVNAVGAGEFLFVHT